MPAFMELNAPSIHSQLGLLGLYTRPGKRFGWISTVVQNLNERLGIAQRLGKMNFADDRKGHFVKMAPSDSLYHGKIVILTVDEVSVPFTVSRLPEPSSGGFALYMPF